MIENEFISKSNQMIKYANKTNDARAIAHITKGILTLKLGIGKFSSAKTQKLANQGRNVMDLQKQSIGMKALANVTNPVGSLARSRFTNDYTKISSAMRIDFLLDIIPGLTLLTSSMISSQKNQKNAFDKIVEFLGDATSLAHYSWIMTRAVMKGKLEWSDINSDLEKKLSSFRDYVEPATDEMYSWAGSNSKLIADIRIKRKSLRAQ